MGGRASGERLRRMITRLEVRDRGSAPAAMRARRQADLRASIGVSSRRGWGPGASEKKPRLRLRHDGVRAHPDVGAVWHWSLKRLDYQKT